MSDREFSPKAKCELIDVNGNAYNVELQDIIKALPNRLEAYNNEYKYLNIYAYEEEDYITCYADEAIEYLDNYDFALNLFNEFTKCEICLIKYTRQYSAPYIIELSKELTNSKLTIIETITWLYEHNLQDLIELVILRKDEKTRIVIDRDREYNKWKIMLKEKLWISQESEITVNEGMQIKVSTKPYYDAIVGF